jgi:hypothetical protein
MLDSARRPLESVAPHIEADGAAEGFHPLGDAAYAIDRGRNVGVLPETYALP